VGNNGNKGGKPRKIAIHERGGQLQPVGIKKRILLRVVRVVFSREGKEKTRVIRGKGRKEKSNY